jgi:hypothetical protein
MQNFIEQVKVPELSIVVVDNYQVVFSQVAGLKDSGTQNKIDNNQNAKDMLLKLTSEKAL